MDQQQEIIPEEMTYAPPFHFKEFAIGFLLATVIVLIAVFFTSPIPPYEFTEFGPQQIPIGRDSTGQVLYRPFRVVESDYISWGESQQSIVPKFNRLVDRVNDIQGVK